MNESTESSKFQTTLRKALPGCEVIKHADKSMIGMVDASVTYAKHTVWMEYKFICADTKGVRGSEFNSRGEWGCFDVALASPTQFDTAKRLARAGHCCYLFWVVDHRALRKRIRYISMWHPLTCKGYAFNNNEELVTFFTEHMSCENPLSVITDRF